MGQSTLFPGKPASRVTPMYAAWPTPVELRCGECGYGVTARRELDHCPMCGAAGAWRAPATRYRSAPSIRRAR
jgi:rubrerythrin